MQAPQTAHVQPTYNVSHAGFLASNERCLPNRYHTHPNAHAARCYKPANDKGNLGDCLETLLLHRAGREHA